MNVGLIQLRCPICQELVDVDNTYSLRCGHIFDEHCIRTWLSSSRKCPCCRATARVNQLVKMHFDFATHAVHGAEATPADAARDPVDGQEEEDVELKEALPEHEVCRFSLRLYGTKERLHRLLKRVKPARRKLPEGNPKLVWFCDMNSIQNLETPFFSGCSVPKSGNRHGCRYLLPLTLTVNIVPFLQLEIVWGPLEPHF